MTVLAIACCLTPKLAQADNKFVSVPAHLKTLKSQSLQKVLVPSKKLLSAHKNGANFRFALNLNQTSIDIGIDEVNQNTRGTRSFVSSFTSDAKDWTLIYTQGRNSGFGELFGNGQHLLIEQRGEQVFAVDVGLSGLTPGIYANDAVGELKAPNKLGPFSASAFEKNTNQVAENVDVIVVDLMLLFTQNIVDTFPGDMTQTLMEYLVFK